jgi:hypothetical protein
LSLNFTIEANNMPNETIPGMGEGMIKKNNGRG